MFSIIFSSSIIILKIIKIFISKDAINGELIKAYKWLIPVGIIIHIIFMIERSYVLTKVKWYIDIKNISTNNILMAFNFIGTISFFCFTFIATFIKCTDNKFGTKLCLVYQDIQNKYYENFIIYFSEFKNIEAIEIVIELAAIICGSLIFFFKIVLHIFIIKYFSPIYIIFLQPLYFISYKIILIIATLISEHSFFINTNKTKDGIIEMRKRFFLDVLGDVLSCIAFLIYLEIFELNFCKCNYNLKKNIIKKGEIETSFELDESYFQYCINGDIEEVEKIEGVQRDSNGVNLLSPHYFKP
jgi:hypothetical protein